MNNDCKHKSKHLIYGALGWYCGKCFEPLSINQVRKSHGLPRLENVVVPVEVTCPDKEIYFIDIDTSAHTLIEKPKMHNQGRLSKKAITKLAYELFPDIRLVNEVRTSDDLAEKTRNGFIFGHYYFTQESAKEQRKLNIQTLWFGIGIGIVASAIIYSIWVINMIK